MKNKIHKCVYPGCNTVCFSNSSLIIHHRVHTKLKPFKCKNCDKRFSQQGNLRRHIESCSRFYVRKITCCDIDFMNMNSYKEHRIVNHSNYSYKCPFERCSAIFPTKMRLRKHMKVCEINNKKNEYEFDEIELDMSLFD